MNFIDLGINSKTVDILKREKIFKPTPVQRESIPIILKNQNIIVQSKTGSGKTLAFLLPIIERMNFEPNEVLILAPTRELAKQIYSVAKSLRHPKVKALTIYGGVSIDNQIRKLNRGINVIIGTPGRIIDLWKRRKLNLSQIKKVVVDEADRLFDMGFAPDVKYILDKIQNGYQFMLFSATIHYEIREMAKKYSKNKFKFVNLSKDDLTVESTDQYFYMIDRFDEKFDSFLEILKEERPKHVLVFVNTKKTANWLNKRLINMRNFRYRVGLISGDLSQSKREAILSSFREHKINMLIATNVAARGLDIDNISHVINYDIPKYPDEYVHRIGRTSRMKKKGTAITLCLKDEYNFLTNIEGLIDKEIRRKMLPNQNQYHDFRYQM